MTCPRDIKKAVSTWIWSPSRKVWDQRYIFASHLHIASFETLGMDVPERGDKGSGTTVYQSLVEEYDIIKETDKQPPRGKGNIGRVIW